MRPCRSWYSLSMPKNQAGFMIDDERRASPPLTAAEKAAVKRAEDDIKAGRVQEHDKVAERLRHRAAEIVGRARGAKSR